MSGTVYQNALAPEACEMQVPNASAPAPQYDLSTVTAASFRVRLPNGQIVTWAATFAYASGVVTVTYPYQAGDTALLGPYVVVAHLTLPGGTLRSLPDSFQVVDEFRL